jgi:CDP-paratose 2-epimerase
MRKIPGYTHFAIDIRNRAAVLEIRAGARQDAIVHTAAQPTHDRAASIPFEDFETNARGTLNLLEATRKYSPESPFVHMSTNIVYVDLSNSIRLDARETRCEYADERFANGIPESFPIDLSTHSLFGASKAAADLLVRGMFSYWLHAYRARRHLRYIGFSGTGKQMRDALHPEGLADRLALEMREPGRTSAHIWNIAGGIANAISLGELTGWCNERFGRHEPSRVSRRCPLISPGWSWTPAAPARCGGWSPHRTLPSILEEIAPRRNIRTDWRFCEA